jgi:polygalacturonase
MKKIEYFLSIAAFGIVFFVATPICHSEKGFSNAETRLSNELSIQDTTQSGSISYKASVFGCMSDGVTLNTTSIQTAINAINAQGGGSLHFYVGRYLTGTIHLKSNVTIVLHEGATLVGVPSIYDYDAPAGYTAPRGLIVAEGQTNIGVIGALPETPSTPPTTEPDIIGSGIIQGNGARLLASMNKQQQNGYLTTDSKGVALISFVDCDGVRIEGLTLQEAAGDLQVYHNCRNISIARLLISGHSTANSNGLTAVGCNNLSVINSFFDVSGRPYNLSNNVKNIRTKGNRTPSGSFTF